MFQNCMHYSLASMEFSIDTRKIHSKEEKNMGKMKNAWYLVKSLIVRMVGSLSFLFLLYTLVVYAYSQQVEGMWERYCSLIFAIIGK